MNTCLLIPLLVGLISALLGYLLGKLLGGKNDNELTIFKKKIASLEADLDECEKSRVTIERNLKSESKNVSSSFTSGSTSSSSSSEVNLLKDKVAKLEAELKEAKSSASNSVKKATASKAKSGSSGGAGASTAASSLTSTKKTTTSKGSKSTAKSSSAAGSTKKTTAKKTTVKSATKSSSSKGDSNFDAAAAKEALGKRIKQDDLKIVEGIGPKIEGLFHNFGIKTWKDLSEATIAKCKEVLESGGDRYRMHKPDTWPKQAKFAYQGKWKELAKWQDELDGGRK